jgi:hypothetical protein
MQLPRTAAADAKIILGGFSRTEVVGLCRTG